MHVLETMIGSILIGGPFSRSAGTITFHKRVCISLLLMVALNAGIVLRMPSARSLRPIILLSCATATAFGTALWLRQRSTNATNTVPSQEFHPLYISSRQIWTKFSANTLDARKFDSSRVEQAFWKLFPTVTSQKLLIFEWSYCWMLMRQLRP